VTFDDHVRAALDELPPALAGALKNVAVLPPDTISIYRVPLEESFPDAEELREEIRITVLHELGHYFGLDEERIDELGYG
jgi:predicted Zn-dependent protease with MMP-like domain